MVYPRHSGLQPTDHQNPWATGQGSGQLGFFRSAEPERIHPGEQLLGFFRGRAGQRQSGLTGLRQLVGSTSAKPRPRRRSRTDPSDSSKIE